MADAWQGISLQERNIGLENLNALIMGSKHDYTFALVSLSSKTKGKPALCFKGHHLSFPKMFSEQISLKRQSARDSVISPQIMRNTRNPWRIFSAKPPKSGEVNYLAVLWKLAISITINYSQSNINNVNKEILQD